MNIILIGFMGSGKSGVGRKLSVSLGYQFVDMDHLIEEKEGMSVSTIFTIKGENKFRKLELKTLQELVQKDNLVISTGGGVPCQPGNMELINKHGVSIYLKMNAKGLFERLKTRQARRPLIKDLSEMELKEYIRSTLAVRERYYTMAKFTVDGSKRDVDDILALLKD